MLEVLPAALSFTLQGAVESLLSAKVADGITRRKHRYNMEVVAQGIANVASAIFGGISLTGTIARTATNIRSGACRPVSGMAHAVFVLLFMLVAAPPGQFHPAVGIGGRAARGVLEHGGEGRVRSPASRLALGLCADRDLRPYRDRRSDIRDYRRMRVGRGVSDLRSHPSLVFAAGLVTNCENIAATIGPSMRRNGSRG